MQDSIFDDKGDAISYVENFGDFAEMLKNKSLREVSDVWVRPKNSFKGKVSGEDMDEDKEM